MAIADLIRRTGGNSIEAVTPADPPRPVAPAAAPATAVSSAPPAAAPAAASPEENKPGHVLHGARPVAGKAPAWRSEPEAIAARYYVEDAGNHRRFFEDYQRKLVAFTATDTRLSSSREDLRTVRDMVDVAASRGWQSLDLKGSETFRREAWIEAAARGLDARGYKASDPDRQEAERRRAERGQSVPTNDVTRGAGEVAVASAAASLAATPATPAAAMAAAGRHGSDGAPARPAATERPSPSSGQTTPATPAEQRKALRAATANLSDDGRLVLAALSEKIDRQMNRYNSDAKAELKLFVATELQAKERTQGPVQLSAEQRRAASVPEPGKAAAAPAQAPAPAAEPRRDPEVPRVSRAR